MSAEADDATIERLQVITARSVEWVRAARSESNSRANAGAQQ